MSEQPDRLGVDAQGFVWRYFDATEHESAIVSMALGNADNSPIPEPVAFYEPADRIARLKAVVEAARSLVASYGVTQIKTAFGSPATIVIRERFEAMREALEALEQKEL